MSRMLRYSWPRMRRSSSRASSWRSTEDRVRGSGKRTYQDRFGEGNSEYPQMEPNPMLRFALFFALIALAFANASEHDHAKKGGESVTTESNQNSEKRGAQERRGGSRLQKPRIDPVKKESWTEAQ